MAVKTKPIRIFEADHPPIRSIAGAKGMLPAEFIHTAVEEYVINHRDELAVIYAETQAALAAGDLDGLARSMAAAAASQVDDMMAHRPLRRSPASS
jgi:hypothetical protein